MKTAEYVAAAAALHDQVSCRNPAQLPSLLLQIARLAGYFDCFDELESRADLPELHSRLRSPPSKPARTASRLSVGLGTFEGSVSASQGLLSTLQQKAQQARQSMRRLVGWAIESNDQELPETSEMLADLDTLERAEASTRELDF